MIRSNKAKRVIIRIKENDGVSVSVPYTVSFKNAEEFVFQKAGWIETNLKKIQNLETKRTLFDETSVFHTFYNILVIHKGEVTRPRAKVAKGYLQIAYPAHRNVHEESIQQFINKAIEVLLRNEAKYYLPKRVKELAELFNFSIKKVYVKNVKTRWGSCSAVNNINLNIHLMRLPKELIDYVILHELCHTIHKNHGKDFWVLLDSLTQNNARKYAKNMRNYRISVF